MGFHEGLDARRHERASVLRAHAVLLAPHAVLVTRAAVQLQPERANEAEEDVAGDDGVHVALEAFYIYILCLDWLRNSMDPFLSDRHAR